ncbi:MAG: hypothetical protein ABIB65_05715 [Candidatus Margulisiibacteriota bacterium]
MKKLSAKELFCIVLSLLPPAFLIFWAARLYFDIPFYDQWDFVPLLEKLYQGKLGWWHLWQQHNEHRLFLPKIVMLALARLSGWNISWELAFNIMLGGAIYSCLLYMFFRTQKRLGLPAVAWPVPALSLMAFSMNQMENWMWGWQMQILMCVLFAVAGIILLTGEKLDSGRFSLALVAGVAASFSFASGLGYWLAGLVPLAARQEAGRKNRLIVWCTLTFLVVFFYFLGYQRPLYSPSMWTFVHKPLMFANYALSFVGGYLFFYPWSLVAGVLGLLVFCFFCLLLAGSVREKRGLVLPYISLAVFSFVSALITGVGRVGLGIQQSGMSRYKSFSMLFWAGLIIICYLLIQCRTKLNRGTRFAAGLAAVMILFFLVFNSLRWTDYARLRRERLEMTKQALLRGKEDPILFFLHQDPTIFPERIEVLKKYHLNIWR